MIIRSLVIGVTSITAARSRALSRDLQKMGSAKRILRKFARPMCRTSPNPDQSVRLKYAPREIGATMAKRITAMAGVTSTAMEPGREKMDLLNVATSAGDEKRFRREARRNQLSCSVNGFVY